MSTNTCLRRIKSGDKTARNFRFIKRNFIAFQCMIFIQINVDILQIFDELGYLNIPPCLWGSEKDGLIPAEYLSYDTNLLSIKKNNNTFPHYGEMASWQMRGILSKKKIKV